LAHIETRTNAKAAFQHALTQIKGEDVQTMAPLEHARWCQEKISEGWKYGSDKDDEQKTNPNLVPWEDLRHDGINKNKKLSI